MMPADWTLDAVCAQVDPEIFFPEKGGSPAEAKRLCGNCPVLAQCQEAAFAVPGTIGVWGGTTRKERELIVQARIKASEAKRRQPTRMVVSRRRALALLAQGQDPMTVASIVGVTDRTIHRWKAAA